MALGCVGRDIDDEHYEYVVFSFCHSEPLAFAILLSPAVKMSFIQKT
jgi:hypothetical protein